LNCLLCQYAVNFPPLTARLIWERYTNDFKDKDIINIWDPSSGWGGRLLGALSVKSDRNIHYIGTDPNQDHTLPDGTTKYDNFAEFYNTKSNRGHSLFPHTNSWEIHQCGSEVFQETERYKELIDDVKNYSPKVKYKKAKTYSGNLLEVNIPDLHIGKKSWAEETGVKNYDINTAINRFKVSLDDMLSHAIKSFDFDQVLFIVGNDLFNSDNAYPVTTTTAGTYQQDDTRWQKVFREGRRLIIETILKLREIAPVEVKIVPGNHDFQKSFYLGDVLEARFHNDENVTIDNSPRTRKYYTWGKCLLGFAHGNRKDESEGRLLANMKHECAKYWGDTIYREWHCGDIHHYKELQERKSLRNIDKYAEDIDGVIIKYLRTLMFNDEWEAKKGFISQKGAHLFVWNKDEGNIVEYKYNKYD